MSIGILGVEDRGDLFGDRLQLVEADAALLVHEEAHELPAAAPLDLDVHELEAAALRHPLGDRRHDLRLRSLAATSGPSNSQKKEWGEPTLVQHPELEHSC